MDDQATIGARLRVLRRWRGMTQVQLAGRAGLSQSFLSQVENGQLALDRRSHIADVAAALQVSEVDVIGGPHLSADPIQSDPHTLIPGLRAALLTNTLTSPACDRARPLRQLIADTRALEPLVAACDYIELGGHLPAIIDELHLRVADPEDEAAHRLALETLITACDYAAFRSKDLGYLDLAHVAATRATEAAAILDNPIQRGKAAFLHVQTMPRGDAWGRTLAMAERAASVLQPHAADPSSIPVCGMLTLSAALAAACLHRGDTAAHWLKEAKELAARVPDEPAGNWASFSMTNVQIWGVAIAVENGETGNAVAKLASAVDEKKLASRHSRHAAFLTDVGRGLAREPKTRNEAVRWLRRAEGLTPQRTRNSAPVRHTLEVLHEQALTSAVSVELRGMMARMGIPH